MSQVPVNDRPRERLAARGAEALGDRELLALLLGTGGAAGTGAHELAERLLDRFGSVTAIGRATVTELASIKGIGAAKASGLVAGFELARRCESEIDVRPYIRSTSDVAVSAAPMLRGRTRERLVVISCDGRGRVLGVDAISDGAIDHTLLPVREVLVAVLRRDGKQFGIAHNHPSGDLRPSRQDIEATLAIEDAAVAAGLRFLDHVVLTDTAWQRVTASR